MRSFLHTVNSDYRKKKGCQAQKAAQCLAHLWRWVVVGPCTSRSRKIGQDVRPGVLKRHVLEDHTWTFCDDTVPSTTRHSVADNAAARTRVQVDTCSV